MQTDDIDIPTQGKLFGKYRGIVVGVDDPEARGRYQVFIYGVHRWFDDGGNPASLTRDLLNRIRDGGDSIDDSTDDPRSKFNAFPWAETISYSGKLFGDIPFYSPGELVWVEFEGGSRDYPVVVGGWISQSMKINDLAPEQQQDYPNSRYVWLRADRWGNSVSQSGMGDESWVRLVSGLGKHTNHRLDDSIRIETVGSVGLDAMSVSIRGGRQGIFLAGCDVFINACADGIAGDNNPEHHTDSAQTMLGLYSNWKSDWYAKDEMWMGQYASRERDPDNDNKRIWHQSRLVTVTPRQLILGAVCDTTKSLYNRLSEADAKNAENTLSVDIEGSSYVILRSGPNNGGPGAPETAGFVGAYSNGDMEIWAEDQILVGMYVQAMKPCQNTRFLLQSASIYLGTCADSDFAPPGGLFTYEMHGRASDAITFITCGAVSHPSSSSYPDDPGMALAWSTGDVVIWAAHNVIICANNQVQICGGCHANDDTKITLSANTAANNTTADNTSAESVRLKVVTETYMSRIAYDPAATVPTLFAFYRTRRIACGYGTDIGGETRVAVVVTQDCTTAGA